MDSKIKWIRVKQDDGTYYYEAELKKEYPTIEMIDYFKIDEEDDKKENG